MPTYNEKFRENLLCLEESEMSDKTGKISPERRSYQSAQLKLESQFNASLKNATLNPSKNSFTTFFNEFILRGQLRFWNLLPDARQMTRYVRDWTEI